MDKPVFLLLGGNRLNLGVLEKFRRRGFAVFVVDWNENPQMTGDRHYKLDVKEPGPIIDALKKDGVLGSVRLAYSSIDLAVASVAAINRAIGLQTIGEEGLSNSISKTRMTSNWGKAGLLNRFSAGYGAYDPAIAVMCADKKLIIKPDNSSSSRGITVLEKGSASQDVIAAYERASKESGGARVIVEEFVEGTEFTVEMLGDARGNVAVYGISRKSHTDNTDRNKVAVKLHYNSVPEELQKRIASRAADCYRALGFSNSMGHLEIILKPDGSLSPVEIGARSSGFIASDLVDIVSGRDFIGDWENVMRTGELVRDGLMPQTRLSSMLFFYDLPAGSTVLEECALTDFMDGSIISRYSWSSRITKGYTVPLIDDDNSRLGFEILEGPASLMTGDYIRNAEMAMLRRMVGK